MATKIDYAQLTEDLKMARALAEAANKITPDRGTSNLDALVLLMGDRKPGSQVISRASKKLYQAFEDAGCELDRMAYRGGRDIYLGLNFGQSYNRHRAIKIARDYLQHKGWPVVMHCQMD